MKLEDLEGWHVDEAGNLTNADDASDGLWFVGGAEECGTTADLRCLIVEEYCIVPMAVLANLLRLNGWTVLPPDVSPSAGGPTARKP